MLPISWALAVRPGAGARRSVDLGRVEKICPFIGVYILEYLK